MKRAFIYGSVFGFCLSVLWGIADFLLFNVPEGTFARWYWTVNHATVPLGNINKLWYLDPPLNALVYALVFTLVYAVAHLSKRLIQG